MKRLIWARKKPVESSKGGDRYSVSRFVSKLIDLVRSHGKTLLWGDIILKHPELKAGTGDVVLNWGYGADITDENIRILADTESDNTFVLEPRDGVVSLTISRLPAIISAKWFNLDFSTKLSGF